MEEDWILLTYAALLAPSLTQQYFTSCPFLEPLDMHCTLDNLWGFSEGSKILVLGSDLWIKRTSMVCYKLPICSQLPYR